jgi:dihydroflavonol-4-reductase
VRIFVTGATGFVGSVLIPGLVGRYGKENVSALVLPGDPLPDAWRRSGIRLIEGDIRDRPSVARAVESHTHVVHLAGIISYWKGDAGRLEEINVDGVRSIVEACLSARVTRLIHVSSVGAIGFDRSGRPADESTPFNWPPDILYMVSKRRGQDLVERAVRDRALPAVILNPASIMGPGDHNPKTPHNELYRRISRGFLFGSFSGGLSVVDVRDLVAVILEALEGRGRDGQSYLVVGDNLPYREVIRLIAKACGRRVAPFPIPAPALFAAGRVLEGISRLTGRRPLLTAAYGRLSGWTAYYDNAKSRAEFGHAYIPVERTIRDGWDYYRRRRLTQTPSPPYTFSRRPGRPTCR